MDKRHWISVFLDGKVPRDVLLDLCDRSYGLVCEADKKDSKGNRSGIPAAKCMKRTCVPNWNTGSLSSNSFNALLFAG